ncbi:conserved hypothetical protein [Ricinus communis]|uniref:AP2/ERF domain-containing protein n=1 Tax=Ricinus communis TaxID=3988 RepID=B9T5Q9_RICCO|nr:conserved hypothetical protein [Ricinus communis]
MKFINNDDNNNNTNWLGFSLSPNHMKMEVNNHQTQSPSSSSVPTAIPASLFHSQSHLSYSSYCGAVEGEHSGFYFPLPVMPLKSDGSLCMMEALARSQPQATTVTNSTPKLEDFFGGATMGNHHYETNDREAMALSLDSMYYHQQQQHQDHDQANNQNCLNHLHQSSRQQQQQQQQQIQAQHYPYYSTNFRSYEIAMTYGDLQSLSLSMSPGSQSSCITGSQQIASTVTECAAMETKKRGPDKVDQKPIVHRKSIDTFGQRTSQYRGVTRHRWTGRYEAHLWDNSCKKEGQSRKGRQGGYDMEEKAARAYDLAALKYWGPSTHINFPLENYQQELEEMKNMTRQEYVAHLRRKSSGFSRGASMYRGVTRHHQHGRWQARIGRVAGNKDLYLGTFSTQEEAAEAYDIAAIKFRGANAVTNFDITRYDVERIMASNTLLAGELARRNKDTGAGNEATAIHNPSIHNSTPTQENAQSESDWKMALYQSSQQLDQKASNIIDNYKTQAFALAPENVIGIDAIRSVHQQQDVEDSAKMGNHLSNASSLVTSLSSSREGSPDRASLPMLFAMPPSATSKLYSTSPSSNMNSWIPTAQLRPAVTLPHMPVFAAWTDA